MSTYSEEQLCRYLAHIRFDDDPMRQDALRLALVKDPLQLLGTLMLYHRARVPFESLSLHYSSARFLSLDPEDLYHKIVERGRGGYCMEVNTFFATVLRTLGYSVISSAGRVNVDGTYIGWNHMVNLVTILGKRYLVDVGFGSKGPNTPILLEPGGSYGIPPAMVKLEYRALSIHTDPDQRVWVLSSQENYQTETPWKELYAFVETEYFRADFEIMNLATMTAPQSFFVQNVMCVRTILDEKLGQSIGEIILHRDYVKRRVAGSDPEILETLETEAQRVEALKKYFDIELSPAEQRAIRGLASQLVPKAGHA
ncbi:acetyltransferase-like protein [Lasiosphaeris hirsuta]|uniref:Acetyltransferase-like protein n=1 Tax=Lasiosphaeris hirsuta TaxID=260670 RepID=A0AA40DPF6_9PEZI|nr:acetyltransferase-like protein [Lasiosphaeris hirsuta]